MSDNNQSWMMDLWEDLRYAFLGPQKFIATKEDKNIIKIHKKRGELMETLEEKKDELKRYREAIKVTKSALHDPKPLVKKATACLIEIKTLKKRIDEYDNSIQARKAAEDLKEITEEREQTNQALSGVLTDEFKKKVREEGEKMVEMCEDLKKISGDMYGVTSEITSSSMDVDVEYELQQMLMEDEDSMNVVGNDVNPPRREESIDQLKEITRSVKNTKTKQPSKIHDDSAEDLSKRINELTHDSHPPRAFTRSNTRSVKNQQKQQMPRGNPFAKVMVKKGTKQMKIAQTE